MSTQDLSGRIDAINPETFNWADATAYAALGVGEPGDDDPQADEGNAEPDDVIPQGEADTAPAAAAPAAATVAAPASSASPAAAPATEPAPAAPKEGEGDVPVEGIATKDGKRIIPYGVLQAERHAAREAREEAARERELREQAEARIAELQGKGKAPAAGENELVDRALADPESLTDEEIEEVAQDFPALAKPLKMIRATAERVSQLTAAPAPAPAPARTDSTAQEAEQEAFDDGIAANPLLAGWMAQPEGKEWGRARMLDRALLASDPGYVALPYAERFAKVQKLVAAEFDIPLPTKPAAAPAPAPAPAAAGAKGAAPAARSSAPPSLTDLGGSTPLSGEDSWNAMTTTDALAKTEHMTEAQLLRMAGVTY